MVLYGTAAGGAVTALVLWPLAGIEHRTLATVWGVILAIVLMVVLWYHPWNPFAQDDRSRRCFK